MSYRVHASGTMGFHYQRSGITFGDVYELADALTNIASPPSSPSEFASSQFQNGLSTDSPVQQTLNAGGRILGRHQLRNCLTTLFSACPKIEISVTARKPNLLLPDTVAFTRAILPTGVLYPDNVFTRGIMRTLIRTGMNGHGVLTGIAGAVGAYIARGRSSRDRQFVLNIHVTET